ncbi:MAG: polysaccharide biosynthesis/export family protein, partial [Bacteroidota bacterium]
MLKFAGNYVFMGILVRAVFLSAFFMLFFVGEFFAQSLSDFQNVKVDDLSDSQVQQIIDRARAEGLGESDIYNLARSRSVPEAEIQKLQQRIAALNKPTAETEEIAPPKAEKAMPVRKSRKISTENNYYHGYSFFEENAEKLSFETDLFTPVPEEYVLGPRDEITINIYGSSERLYKATISETGYLNIPNVGPVFIAGLTIEKASSILKGRLSKLYRDLAGSNPTSYMIVTISRIRNLKVNIVGEVQRPGTYTINALATVFNA